MLTRKAPKKFLKNSASFSGVKMSNPVNSVGVYHLSILVNLEIRRVAMNLPCGTVTKCASGFIKTTSISGPPFLSAGMVK